MHAHVVRTGRARARPSRSPAARRRWPHCRRVGSRPRVARGPGSSATPARAGRASGRPRRCRADDHRQIARRVRDTGPARCARQPGEHWALLRQGPDRPQVERAMVSEMPEVDGRQHDQRRREDRAAARERREGQQAQEDQARLGQLPTIDRRTAPGRTSDCWRACPDAPGRIPRGDRPAVGGRSPSMCRTCGNRDRSTRGGASRRSRTRWRPRASPAASCSPAPARTTATTSIGPSRRQDHEPASDRPGRGHDRQESNPSPASRQSASAGRQRPARRGPEEREAGQAAPGREPRHVRPEAQDQRHQRQDRQGARRRVAAPLAWRIVTSARNSGTRPT